jgi:hypothetical protein
MYQAVIKVQPLENYNLLLTFKNGEEGVFDMNPYLALDVFKPLQDTTIFNTVKVSFDTIEWCGEIDIDPETLYHSCEKIVASTV